MKKLFTFVRRTIGPVLLSIVVSQATVHAAADSIPVGSITQLERFRSDYVTGFLSANPALLTRYCSEAMRLMPDFQPTLITRANVVSYYTAFFRRFGVSRFVSNRLEVTDLGARIIEIGNFEQDLTLKTTGKKRTLVGKYLDVWEKRADGSLSLLTQAWNYNHAVPFSDELRFPEVPAIIAAFQPRVVIHDRTTFELAALDKLLESVVQEHDAKTWARFYADDGMFLYSYNPIYSGRKALDEFLDRHARELPVFEKLDIRCDQIDDLGRYVIQYASHVANWRNGDSSGVSTGKNIRIWRREADGSLHHFRTIAMYD